MDRGKTADVSLGKPIRSLTGVLALCLAALAFVAVMIGPFAPPPGQTVMALLGQGDDQASIVVWNIRVPRVAAALSVGAALAAAGAS